MSKNALITGSSHGIGAATAVALAKEGYNVGITYCKNPEGARQVQAQCLAFGVEAKLYGADFQVRQDCERLMAEFLKDFGTIDVLINNAGVASNASFEESSMEEFDKIMTVNVKVPFFLTQKLLPLLKRSETPFIINIASVTGHAGYPMQSVYSASKHALLGWTKALAAECYKEKIRVHAVSPGGVYTDMVKVTRPDLTPEGMIMPEDIADIVEFLLTHRSNAVVDEILVHREGKVPFQV